MWFLKIMCLLPTLMCPSRLLINTLLRTKKYNISLVIAFEPVERIAKTVHGLNKTRISIDTSKIVSAGLFHHTLMHEIGHAVFDRRDLSGDIMNFHILMDPMGRLYQHVPYYNLSLKYHPFAHLHGNGSIVPEWF